MKPVLTVLAALTALSMLTGCAAFRLSIKEGDPEDMKSLTAGYDQRDLYSWTDEMAEKILNHPFPPSNLEQPICVVLGIENRTQSHLDMKALSDTITTKLLDSGKLQFVNAARRDDLLKEQGYQLANATDATRASIGKQLGAKYMITGSLVEIKTKSGRQVRVSKKEDRYYQMTVEVSDLETGLIVLRKQVDRIRRASKPLIGW